MPNLLSHKHVTLCVTGSIACYKAVDLASKLTQQGALVDVVLTQAATRFVTPLTFSSITHRPVYTDLFEPDSELGINHVAVAERSDVIVIAPATANSIGKISWGLADDVVTTTILATRAPIIIAPAMDANMYDNPATMENVRRLESRGYTIVGPDEGRLASGLIGKGRLVDTSELLGAIRMVLARDGDMVNRKIVVSAGGTREPIDPVRVLSNRSSGKMGYAIAEAARDRGASPVLVTAPTALADPVGVRVVHVETALQMREAVLEECNDADAVIMAAAVADWRPVTFSDQKVKKGESSEWSVELTKNPDILADVPGNGVIKIGFAAESENLVANAQAKLFSKGLHLIIANDITAADSGFAVDTNRVHILDREGGAEELPLMAKYEVGHRILDRIVPMLK